MAALCAKQKAHRQSKIKRKNVKIKRELKFQWRNWTCAIYLQHLWKLLETPDTLNNLPPPPCCAAGAVVWHNKPVKRCRCVLWRNLQYFKEQHHRMKLVCCLDEISINRYSFWLPCFAKWQPMYLLPSMMGAERLFSSDLLPHVHFSCLQNIDMPTFT